MFLRYLRVADKAIMLFVVGGKMLGSRNDFQVMRIDPDAAEAIIKAVGDVEYKIPYQAAFNDNKDNILLQMSPEPLVLEIAMEPQPIRKTEGEEETPKLTVKVTIKADEKGSYAYEGQKLKFAIQATEVTVNEERFDKFPATTFSFDMTKK